MFSSRFQELSDAMNCCTYTSKEGSLIESEALQKAFQLISETVRQKGIVYVIGNGGSAGIASHFSNDLMKALRIPSQTFYDSNLMTCLSNDIGYENVFSYPLERVLKREDFLVAISSSGKSPNILRAAEVAIQRKTPLLTLSGFLPSNPLRTMGNLNFWVDRADYGLVETAHFFLLHTIIDLWNKRLSGMTDDDKATLSCNAK
ncbi:MAG TPA: SIS domain-containing protein [Chlamydiales bacterium]|nr:SIS domain-containing protein [Chlamydiales bacterium]